MGRHGRGMGDNINIKTVNLAEELQNQDGIPTQEPIRHSGSSVCIWQKRKGTCTVGLVYVLITRG